MGTYSEATFIQLDDNMCISPNDQKIPMHFIDIPSIYEACMSFVCPFPKSSFVIEDHTLDLSSHSFQDTSQLNLGHI